MNASFKFFNTKFQGYKKNFLLKNKKYLLALPIIYSLKNLLSNKKKALCFTEGDEEHNVMDFNDMYSDFEESDFANMGAQDQTMSMEELSMLREEAEKAKVTPPFSFARIPQLFMNQNDDKWNGLKFSLDWKPTKMYSLQYTASTSSLKRIENYSLSCLNIVPSKLIIILNFFIIKC